MKKIISISLALAMLLCLVPSGVFGITASAASSGYYTYSVTDGKATITDCDTAISGDVTIPSTLGGYPVTSIGSYAFDLCTSLTAVTIPDGVMSVGVEAFRLCTSLTSVTIGDGVTSIGDRAFGSCDSLASITIPDSVTSIGLEAFSNCSSLTSIIVSTKNTAYCDVNGVLFDKNKTTLVCYPAGKTATNYTIPGSVTSIGELAFYMCGSLTSVTIPDSVTSIGELAFYMCDSLTLITVSVNNTAYCDVDGVLFDKDKTTLVHYPAGKTATSYTIPNSVTSIGSYAFRLCRSLTSITIPDSVTSIGYESFAHCSKLTSVMIGDSVTSIGERAFADCPSLTSMTIPNSVTSIGEEAFNYCTGLALIIIPNSVMSVGDRAFSHCYSLTSITIPDSVTSIGVEAYYNTALYNNSSNWENGVLYIGNHLIKAKESVITGAYTIKERTKTIADDAFSFCDSLTSITIPDSVTSIGDGAFYWCFWLTDVWYLGPNRSKISIGTNNENLTGATWHYGFCKEHSYSAVCDESCNECEYVRVATPHSYSTVCDESCNVCGYVRAAMPHSYSADCDSTCNTCNYVRVAVSHPYDNDCDAYCNLCGKKREVPGHRYTVNNGYTCEVCQYSRTPDAPTMIERTLDTVVLAAHEGFEYRMSGGSWQASNVFIGLSSNTRYTFYQRVKASDVALASGASASLTVNALKAITITFNANGGSGAPSATTATSDIATTLSTTEPTRSGYMFAGWGTTQPCGKQYAPGEAFTSGENVTLYALWTACEACDHCGGDGSVGERCSYCGGVGTKRVCAACGGRVVHHVTGYGSYYECVSCYSNATTTVSCSWCYRGTVQATCSECDGIGSFAIKQAAPTVLSFSDTTVTLLAVSGHEYSKDGVNWQTSNVFTNLSPNTTYTFYRRTAPTATTPFSVASAGTRITTDKSKQPLIPDAPTIQSRTANSITLTPTAGYEYSKNGTTWQTSNVFSGLTCGTSYTFYQRVAATASHYAGTKSAGATFKTDKGTQSAPSAPSLSYKTHKTVVLCDDDGYEYSMDGIHWQANNMFTDLSPETNYLFYRRLAETETHYAGAASAYLVVRTAEAGELMSVVVTTKPSKLTYSEGEALDTTGLVVTAYYSNGTNEPVTDYVVNTTALSVGTNVVTVTYGGKTATFTVSVTAKQVLSIAITTMPSKLEYAAGEELDTRGMVVTAYYDNNTSAVVSDYVVSGYSSTPGSKTVVITYHGKTASFTVVVRQSEKNGWVQESGKWAYYKNGAKLTSQWMADSVGWCYLGADGYMLTNEWVRDSVGWCYVGSDGYCVTNCWMADSVGWCYLDDNGRMATNQWIKDSVGWCYVGSDGYWVTNEWKKDSVGWCYLDKNGRMATNQWIKDSVGWCYVGADGYCVTNEWRKDSVGWCYLDANGRMATNQWIKDSVGWCYVGAVGYAVTNCWKRDSIGWCYLNGNGSMTKNAWVLDGGKWYYLDGNGYMLASTSRYIGGKTYHFNASGVCTNP